MAARFWVRTAMLVKELVLLVALQTSLNVNGFVITSEFISTNGNSSQPVVVCLEDQVTCLVAYVFRGDNGTGSEVRVRKSDDGGLTFASEETTVSSGAYTENDVPSIGCVGQVCTVAWRGDGQNIETATTTNSGVSFASSVTPYSNGFASVGPPDVSCYEASPNSICDIGFMVLTQPGGLHVESSNNNGTTWSAKEITHPTLNGLTTLRLVTGANGAASASISGGINNNGVHYSRRQSTGGVFNLPTQLSVAAANGATSSLAMINTTRVLMVVAAASEIKIAVSTNSGNVFSAFVTAVTTNSTTSDARISCAGDKCLLTWTVLGESEFPEFAISTDAGASWSVQPSDFLGLNGIVAVSPSDGQMYENVDIFCYPGNCITFLEGEGFDANQTGSSLLFGNLNGELAPTPNPTEAPTLSPTTAPTNSTETLAETPQEDLTNVVVGIVGVVALVILYLGYRLFSNRRELERDDQTKANTWANGQPAKKHPIYKGHIPSVGFRIMRASTVSSKSTVSTASVSDQSSFSNQSQNSRHQILRVPQSPQQNMYEKPHPHGQTGGQFRAVSQNYYRDTRPLPDV